ncbi:hypothetical protein C8Q80DRAFT_1123881 [Daedaleopsis nitida]|nr:hypothetical protein C8Q80DRAFT_1123881 [Daedaleopsis nitida]
MGMTAFGNGGPYALAAVNVSQAQAAVDATGVHLVLGPSLKPTVVWDGSNMRALVVRRRSPLFGKTSSTFTLIDGQLLAKTDATTGAGTTPRSEQRNAGHNQAPVQQRFAMLKDNEAVSTGVLLTPWALNLTWPSFEARLRRSCGEIHLATEKILQLWEARQPDLAREADVSVKPADFFFHYYVEEDPAQLSKISEIAGSGVRGFRRSTDIVRERNVNPAYGAVDAYELLGPVIDTDRAMSWLMDLVQRKGVKLVTRTLHGDLLEQEPDLRAEYAVDVIVNATGIAGTELAGDASCYPIRGGLLRVINDGSDFPVIDAALSISADVANEIVFLVPRNDRILTVGGITEPHAGALDYALDMPIIKCMRALCEAFMPQLRLDLPRPGVPARAGPAAIQACSGSITSASSGSSARPLPSTRRRGA